MDRLVLSDPQWDRISGLIIGRPDQRGSTGRDNRMFVEGVLWIVRTGSPWRDLPEAFGEWNSVFRRFSRWSAKGVWLRMFEALADDPDFTEGFLGASRQPDLSQLPCSREMVSIRTRVGQSHDDNRASVRLPQLQARPTIGRGFHTGHRAARKSWPAPDFR